MQNRNSVFWIVTIIGSLSIITGIYLTVKGSSFNETYYAFFLGITLIGTAYFNDKKQQQLE